MLRALIVAVGHGVPVLPPEVGVTERAEAFAGQMEVVAEGKDEWVRDLTSRGG